MASYGPQIGVFWARYNVDGTLNGGMLNIFGIKCYMNMNRKLKNEKSPHAKIILASALDESHEIYQLYKDKFEYKRTPVIAPNVEDQINEL